MKLKLFIFVFLFFLHSNFSQTTNKHNWSINGYITNMQSFQFEDWQDNWTSDNTIHNRINIKWLSQSKNLDASIELRNRFISGETVEMFPGYADMIQKEENKMGLSWNLASGKSYILNTNIDRLYLNYRFKKLQIRVGRQRINWGQCFIWNPNDLFNTYSFFDVDYIEKPGADAIRLEYYNTVTSCLELVVKTDSSNRFTSAALYRFNRWNYDFQLLAGLYNNKDFVVGAGWSGNIINASFRGEVSHFIPRHHFADTTGIWAFSIGSEYLFKNSTTLQFEFLYNTIKDKELYDLSDLYNTGLSAKELSFTQLSMMLQVDYPISPLFNATLSTMYFPKIHGFFVGPTFRWSLTENIDLSFITQSFGGQLQPDTSTTYYQMAYLRLKWNF